MRVALLVGVQDLVVAEVADLRVIKRDLIRSFNGVEEKCHSYRLHNFFTVLSTHLTKGHSFSQP